MTTRREFILSACKACALITTAGLVAVSLEGCKSLKVVKAGGDQENNLIVPLSEFAEANQVLVRSRLTDFDILVVKKSETEFVALLMKCTHESQPLTPSGNSIFCSSHGSKFDLDGNVQLAPATRNLQRYFTRVAAPNLIINLK